MCAYCHRDDLPVTCHGATNSGQPCQRELSGSKRSNYCNHHLDQFNAARYELSMENAWKLAKERVSQYMGMSEAALRDVLHEKIDQKVYFIRDGVNYVKVGTSKDPYSRLDSLSRKGDTTIKPDDLNPELLYVSFLVSGGRQVESWFHGQFHKYHAIGEWFYWDDKMIETITEYEKNYKKSFDERATRPSQGSGN
jgi:hypothetical protein